ncbi:MAG: ATP-grasp domain-containing protein [Gammaproteobacteria bacterium]
MNRAVVPDPSHLAPRIAIVTDEPGWHGAELKRALAARGYAGRYVSLTECHIDLGAPHSVVIPGFGAAPPAGVFVRGVPGGSLEQVTLRLDVLHILKILGVMVYNDARAVERTVDKAMTSVLLKQSGVPTPETWVCESRTEAESLVARELSLGRRLVMKPLFGSQGIGVTLIDTPASVPDVAGSGDVYYLQRYVESRHDDAWRDWRVLVVANRAIAVMLRRSPHWITNRARGGRCHAVDLDRPLCELAEHAARAVGIDYAGVDLLQDGEGRLLVTEVNSVPAWYGLQGVCGFNIAERLVDHLLARIAGATPLEAVP